MANLPVYTLAAPALAIAAQPVGATTTQGALPAHNGVTWRITSAKLAPNTRVGALQVLAAAVPCTAPAAIAALATAKAQGLSLGTGTPASYVKAFVKNGYLTPTIG